MTLRIAPPPSLLRRIVAAPLYAVFGISAAIERALPEWVPPAPAWVDSAAWWCWTKADKIAPGSASRTFDAILERCAADPEFAERFG